MSVKLKILVPVHTYTLYKISQPLGKTAIHITPPHLTYVTMKLSRQECLRQKVVIAALQINKNIIRVNMTASTSLGSLSPIHYPTLVISIQCYIWRNVCQKQNCSPHAFVHMYILIYNRCISKNRQSFLAVYNFKCTERNRWWMYAIAPCHLLLQSLEQTKHCENTMVPLLVATPNRGHPL